MTTARAIPTGPVIGLMVSAFVLAIPVSVAASALGLGSMARFTLVELVCFALPAILAARALGSVGPGTRSESTPGQGSPRELLGLMRPPPRALLGAVLVGATLWLLLALAVAPWASRWQTDADLELLRAAGGGDPLWLRLAVIALLPGICEELLVRGAIARGLRARLGIGWAVAISSVYFSILHLSLARALPTLVLGVVLALAVLRCGSVIPAMILHALNNACAVLVSDPAIGGWLASQWPARWIPLVALPASAATTVGLWLLLRTDPKGRSSPVS